MRMVRYLLTIAVFFSLGSGMVMPFFDPKQRPVLADSPNTSTTNLWNITTNNKEIAPQPQLNTRSFFNSLSNETHFTFYVRNQSGVLRNITSRFTLGKITSGSNQKQIYTINCPYKGTYFLNYTIGRDAVSFNNNSKNNTFEIGYVNENPYTLSYNYTDLKAYSGLSMNGALINNRFRFSVRTTVSNSIKLTLDPLFTIATALANSTGWAFQNKLCRTPNGVLYYPFTASTGAGTTIGIHGLLAQSLDNGSTWNPWRYQFTSNNTGRRNITKNPAAAIDSNGVIYIVWKGQAQGFTHSVIRFRRFFTNNKTFGPSITNLTRVMGTFAVPSIIVDGNDNVFISYDTNKSYIKMKKYYSSNNTWHTNTWNFTTATTSGTTVQCPAMAVDTSNNIYITFQGRQDALSATTAIRHRKWWASNNSMSSKIINVTGTPASGQYNPVSIFDKDGNLNIAWESTYAGKSNNIRYRKWWVSNNSWNSGITNVSREPARWQYSASLGLSGQSNLYCLWVGMNNISTVTYRIRSSNYTYSNNTWWSQENGRISNWTKGQTGTCVDPVIMYAWYPNVSGVQTNIPIHGVCAVFLNGTSIKYLNSSRVDWGVPSGGYTAPTITLITPIRNGTKVRGLKGTIYFWVNTSGNDTGCRVNVYTNETGSYVHNQMNETGTTNKKLNYNYTGATAFKTRYYYNINVWDGTTNVSKWYYFDINGTNKFVSWMNSSFDSGPLSSHFVTWFNTSFDSGPLSSHFVNWWNTSFKSTLSATKQTSFNTSFRNGPLSSHFTIWYNCSFKGQSDVVWVDDSFAPGCSGWLYDHFQTIQEGIDAVASNGTVYVFAGTYTVNDYEVTKRCNIIGNYSATYVDCSGVVWAALYLEVGYTNLSNFNFSYAPVGTNGIYIKAPNCNLSYDIFYANDVGIGLYDYAENCSVMNCSFAKNVIGIYAGDGFSFPYACQNIICHNTFVNDTYGMKVMSNGNRIHDNYFFDEWAIWIDSGLKYSKDNYIYQNFFNCVHDDQAVMESNSLDWNFFYENPESGPNIIGGPAVGGNYWSNNTKRHVGSGFSLPRSIVGTSNVDWYPLVYMSWDLISETFFNSSFKNAGEAKANYTQTWFNSSFKSSISSHFTTWFNTSFKSTISSHFVIWFNSSFKSSLSSKKVISFNSSFKNGPLSSHKATSFNTSFKSSISSHFVSWFNTSFKSSLSSRKQTSYNSSFKNGPLSMHFTTWFNDSFKSIVSSHFVNWMNASFRNNQRAIFSWFNSSFENMDYANITICCEYPLNGSTGVSIYNTVHLNLTHLHGYTMNITWMWGYSDSCSHLMGYSYNKTNGTTGKFFIDSSNSSTTYYWKVIVEDHHHSFANATYYFTTAPTGGFGVSIDRYDDKSWWIFPGFIIGMLLGPFIIGPILISRRKQKRQSVEDLLIGVEEE